MQCYLTRRGISISAAAERRRGSAQFPSRWVVDLCYNRAAATARLCGRQKLNMHAKLFCVSGRVQGVGFRFFAEATASRLGVSGYVKNLSDGRVEIYPIGDERRLKPSRVAVEQGVRMAAVDNVEERDPEKLKEYASGFTIEHDY